MQRFKLILGGIACVIVIQPFLGPVITDAAIERKVSHDLTGQGYKAVKVTDVNKTKTEADIQVQVQVQFQAQNWVCPFAMYALKDGKHWNVYADNDRSSPPVSNADLVNQLTKQANHEPVELIKFPIEDCHVAA